jgi:hypothetical protein
MKRVFVCLLIGSAISLSYGQTVPKDSLQKTKHDSLFTKEGKKIVTIDTYSERFNPRKAILYSAVLPGMGQVYNKKYWKVPLVIGGFFGLISVVNFYHQKEIVYRNDLFDLLNGETSGTAADGTKLSPDGFTESQLRNGINQAERQRDYFLIFTGFFYLLQLVDAHVDAHLKEFELNPQLKVRIEPAMNSNYYTGTSTGIALKLYF